MNNSKENLSKHLEGCLIKLIRKHCVKKFPSLFYNLNKSSYKNYWKDKILFLENLNKLSELKVEEYNKLKKESLENGILDFLDLLENSNECSEEVQKITDNDYTRSIKNVIGLCLLRIVDIIKKRINDNSISIKNISDYEKNSEENNIQYREILLSILKNFFEISKMEKCSREENLIIIQFSLLCIKKISDHLINKADNLPDYSEVNLSTSSSNKTKTYLAENIIKGSKDEWIIKGNGINFTTLVELKDDVIREKERREEYNFIESYYSKDYIRMEGSNLEKESYNKLVKKILEEKPNIPNVHLVGKFSFLTSLSFIYDNIITENPKIPEIDEQVKELKMSFVESMKSFFFVCCPEGLSEKKEREFREEIKNNKEEFTEQIIKKFYTRLGS